MKFQLLKPIIQFLKVIKPPGFHGFSLYDLLEMYIIGIVKGALTYRAGSISFSFFMALFPFILFILNLIPFIDLIPFINIENFDQTFYKKHLNQKSNNTDIHKNKPYFLRIHF